MVEVTLVAQGMVSRVRPLGCHCVNGYRGIGSIGLLPLWLSLRCYLSVVIVVVVVVAVVVVVVVVAAVAVVVVPKLSLVVDVVGAGFGLRDHGSIPYRLIRHTYGDAFNAFICQWVASRDRVLDLGCQAPDITLDLPGRRGDHPWAQSCQLIEAVCITGDVGTLHLQVPQFLFQLLEFGARTVLLGHHGFQCLPGHSVCLDNSDSLYVSIPPGEGGMVERTGCKFDLAVGRAVADLKDGFRLFKPSG